MTHPLKIPALVVLKSVGLPNGPQRWVLYTKRCGYTRYYYQ